MFIFLFLESSKIRFFELFLTTILTFVLPFSEIKFEKLLRFSNFSILNVILGMDCSEISFKLTNFFTLILLNRLFSLLKSFNTVIKKDFPSLRIFLFFPNISEVSFFPTSTERTEVS